MTDYLKMYAELFRSITNAIELLQQAQIKTEEIYISSEETILTLIPEQKTEDDSTDQQLSSSVSLSGMEYLLYKNLNSKIWNKLGRGKAAFCLYEKDYEQFMKEYQNNIINGYTLEDMEVKNRFEIRLKGDRAYHAVYDLVSNEEPEETVFSIINRYLTCLKRDNKKDFEDWDTDKRWAYFIGEHRDKLKLTTKPEPYTLEKTLNWVGKQVAPTIKMLIEYDGISGTQLQGTMLDNARLSNNQQKILEQQALAVEDMVVDSFQG